MPIGRLGDVAELEAGAGVRLDEGLHGPSLRAPVSRARGSVGPVDDRVLDRADALDLAAHAVARLEEDRRVAEHADAGRRAGRDDVARLEGDGAR